MNPKLTISAQKSFYEKNKYRYTTAQAHAQHILLETDDEARKVLALASRKDADFKDLAMKYSKDPTVKTNFGDLGYFFRNQMAPEFSDPVFRAKEGQVIGPIKTQFGFHVIKVIDRSVGKQLSYEEVSDQVKAALSRELTMELVRQLRSSAKIQYLK